MSQFTTSECRLYFLLDQKIIHEQIVACFAKYTTAVSAIVHINFYSETLSHSLGMIVPLIDISGKLVPVFLKPFSEIKVIKICHYRALHPCKISPSARRALKNRGALVDYLVSP